jgi:hypothetical protein
MNWFYFEDETTGTTVRWDRKKQRIRVIDPIDRTVVNQFGINLVEVIQLCSRYLKREVSDD